MHPAPPRVTPTPVKMIRRPYSVPYANPKSVQGVADIRAVAIGPLTIEPSPFVKFMAVITTVVSNPGDVLRMSFTEATQLAGKLAPVKPQIIANT